MKRNDKLYIELRKHVSHIELDSYDNEYFSRKSHTKKP